MKQLLRCQGVVPIVVAISECWCRCKCFCGWEWDEESCITVDFEEVWFSLVERAIVVFVIKNPSGRQYSTTTWDVAVIWFMATWSILRHRHLYCFSSGAAAHNFHGVALNNLKYPGGESSQENSFITCKWWSRQNAEAFDIYIYCIASSILSWRAELFFS